MKKLILLLLIFISALSCEDTKKSTTIEKLNTSTSEKKMRSETKKQSISKKNNQPEITQENAVSFLTEYGTNNPETKVRISTLYGNIDIVLFKDTPLHRANFIYLVKHNYFNETYFHRVVKNFIIQAGSSDLKSTSIKRVEIGSEYRIPFEKGSGRIHKKGTISGAKYYRKNPDNMSVPFEFFIFLGPKSSTTHLNGKYTIFGKVIEGMDVVETISNLPADKSEWPLENIYIQANIIE